MEIQHLKSITAFHRMKGLPKPGHPLISVIDYAKMSHPENIQPGTMVMDFYSIALKRNVGIKLHYGQTVYDFDEGLMSFTAPGQLFKIEANTKLRRQGSGYVLLVHPDFLWRSELAKDIKQYDFFDYSINEALFLSHREEKILIGILENIRHEYNHNIDHFSQDLIIKQLELLLKYSERFYHRQFLTRKAPNYQLLNHLEQALENMFSDDTTPKGLPTVKKVAEKLNVSSNYLNSMLKVLTGQSTQQHIHNKLIEKAKEKLSTSNLTVSQIAYELGFEYSQSFNKLFKNKTDLSPLEFRRKYN